MEFRTISLLKRNIWLLGSIAFSILLLIVFLTFKAQDYLFMDLDVKWMLLAGTPVLMALLLGGYLKSFKGFGLELEVNLSEPISDSLIQKPRYIPQISVTKHTLPFLLNMDNAARQKATILRMQVLKLDYYDAYAVGEYIRLLPNVHFIEIIDLEDKFVSLMPINRFRIADQEQNAQLQNLINALERNKLSEVFPEVITSFVRKEDDLILVYEKFLSAVENEGGFTSILLPVLSRKHQLVGLVYKQDVEAKIAEEVLRSKKRSKHT